MGNAGDLRKELVGKAREQVKEALSQRDLHICRAVAILDELDKSINLFSEHVSEWYGLHFPELADFVEGEEFLRLVAGLRDRKEFEKGNVLQLLKVPEKATGISGAAKNSIGANVPEKALEEIALLSAELVKLKERRKGLEKFVEGEVKDVVPNFSSLTGALIGARMLAKAGSLERLAFMPASTIQLLGAEKALFRHKKSKKSKPPKYGYIFAHSLIQGLPKNRRGAMARTLASKLCIAVRADYFGKKKLGPELGILLQKRFEELRDRKASKHLKKHGNPKKNWGS